MSPITVRRSGLWLPAILVVCALLAACGVSSGGAAASQAVISGVVMAGPTCGAEPAGSPAACAPRPVPNKTVNIIAVGAAATITAGQTPTGPIVATATTDTQGRFSVHVSPGRYVALVASTTGFGMRQMNIPQAKVTAGQSVNVTIYLDTGVR
ncbi:MAG: carboxypeptidase-like regulatory domain-containing protein [Ktedonobacterales bacterium]